MLHVLATREAVAAAVHGERRRGARVGLVPTMGALHRGHLSLLEAAGEASDVVVISIFVNPMQFDEASDFAAYPRDLDADLHLAEGAGARYCFAPSVEEMYPHGPAEVTVDPGRLATILEGAYRPGHLRGVATVVTKLLAVVGADLAFFGEKDYQQLVLVKRLVDDLSLPVRICGGPTIREDDGLALSSRNRRLSTSERAAASVLFRALQAGRRVAGDGGGSEEIETVMGDVLGSVPQLSLDYAVARSSRDLSEAAAGALAGDLRLLVAGHIGGVRLIDNVGASDSATSDSATSDSATSDSATSDSATSDSATSEWAVRP